MLNVQLFYTTLAMLTESWPSDKYINLQIMNGLSTDNNALKGIEIFLRNKALNTLPYVNYRSAL